ncbi:MAG: hypothetical protein ACRD3K_06010, partial [Edaphobacter sp.]
IGDDGFGGLLGGQRALPLDGLNASDVQFESAQLLEALDVTEALLEADAEELFGRLRLLALELIVTEIADLFKFHCLFLNC